jgi:hypothetical protein
MFNRLFLLVLKFLFATFANSMVALAVVSISWCVIGIFAKLVLVVSEVALLFRIISLKRLLGQCIDAV